jgi:hypothetical protein
MTRLEALTELTDLLGASLVGWAAEEPDLTALGVQAEMAEALLVQWSTLPVEDAVAEVERLRTVEGLRSAVAAAAEERFAEIRAEWQAERTAAGYARDYVTEDDPAARYLDDRR